MNPATAMARKSRPIALSVLLMIIGLSGIGCDDKGDDPVYTKALLAPNGDYYRGEIGSTDFEPELKFGVRAADGSFMAGQVIRLAVMEGDGTLTADSVIAGSDGFAVAGYDFTGNLGQAVIRAVGRGEADTLEVVLRADILIPGPSGQGQYVLLDDLYGDVVGLNGPPARVDSIGTVAVANYEAALGMVVLCYDTDFDGILPNNAPVYGVIVTDSLYLQPPDSTTKNARYSGLTSDSIGIGSSYNSDIVPVYGLADAVVLDEEDPEFPAIVVTYDDLFLTFWCFTGDTTVFQIDIFEDFDTGLFGSGTDLPEGLGYRIKSESSK